MKQEKGFLISIDDGYVEYRYRFDISDDECINNIAEKIKTAFGVKMSKGKVRKPQVKSRAYRL